MALQKLSILKQYPNQNIQFLINRQNILVSLYFRGFTNYIGQGLIYNPVGPQFSPYNIEDVITKYARPTFYADITVNGDLIIAGSRVTDRIPINSYPSILKGYIVSIDSKGNANPTISNLGSSVNLYYTDNQEDLISGVTS